MSIFGSFLCSCNWLCLWSLMSVFSNTHIYSKLKLNMISATSLKLFFKVSMVCSDPDIVHKFKTNTEVEYYCFENDFSKKHSKENHWRVKGFETCEILIIFIFQNLFHIYCMLIESMYYSLLLFEFVYRMVFMLFLLLLKMWITVQIGGTLHVSASTKWLQTLDYTISLLRNNFN